MKATWCCAMFQYIESIECAFYIAYKYVPEPMTLKMDFAQNWCNFSDIVKKLHLITLTQTTIYYFTEKTAPTATSYLN